MREESQQAEPLVANPERIFDQWLEIGPVSQDFERRSRSCLELLRGAAPDLLFPRMSELIEHWQLLWYSQGYSWIAHDLMRWLDGAQDAEGLSRAIAEHLQALPPELHRHRWFFLSEMAEANSPGGATQLKTAVYAVDDALVAAPSPVQPS